MNQGVSGDMHFYVTYQQYNVTFKVQGDFCSDWCKMKWPLGLGNNYYLIVWFTSIEKLNFEIFVCESERVAQASSTSVKDVSFA